MSNLRSILKNSFRVLLILVLSTFATEVASAKTISTSNDFINANVLDYFDNVYKRSGYKHYILSNEYVNNGSYNYTTYYYLCLTNSDIDVTDNKSIIVTCDKLYRYYRDNSEYIIEELSDNNLTIDNSIYYTDNFQDNSNVDIKLLIGINISLFTFFITYVLFKVFRS